MNIHSKRNTRKIRELNDSFRQTGIGGQILYTNGIKGFGPEFIRRCMQAISAFDDFNEDNDPHKEHDFGKCTVEGTDIFWKIDYYDTSMQYASPNPAVEAITCRVMTVMLVEEY